jgi:hypothetical protein
MKLFWMLALPITLPATLNIHQKQSALMLERTLLRLSMAGETAYAATMAQEGTLSQPTA